MRIILWILVAFWLLALVCGCATYSVKGHFELVDGKYIKVPDEYLSITGQDSEADYSVHKIKSGKLLPDVNLPSNIEVDK